MQLSPLRFFFGLLSTHLKRTHQVKVNAQDTKPFAKFGTPNNPGEPESKRTSIVKLMGVLGGLYESCLNNIFRQRTIRQDEVCGPDNLHLIAVYEGL